MKHPSTCGRTLIKEDNIQVLSETQCIKQARLAWSNGIPNANTIYKFIIRLFKLQLLSVTLNDWNSCGMI